MLNLRSSFIRSVVPAMAAIVGVSSVSAPTAQAAENADSLKSALTDGKIDFNIRPRYEFVDDDVSEKEANALTVRLALGYTTGVYWDTQAYIGFETTQVLGDQQFNNPVNPEPEYAIVADPEHAELNLYGIRYLGVEDLVLDFGRQRIKHDNVRFVGNVGWRQNEQTFDAATVKYTGIENLKLEYNMVFNVNRIFGDEAPRSSTGAGTTGDDKMFSHLAIGSYKVGDIGTATGFIYLLDYEHKDAADRGTYGARFNGSYKASDDVSIVYSASLAQQTDMFDNDNDVSEMYYHIEVGAKWKGITAAIGYEVLGGDGTASFATPLATLHAWNGWADKFLGTPATGLTDLYASVGGAIPNVDGLTAKAVYHIFEADEGGDEYGTELDLVVVYSLKQYDPAWKIGAKAALYSGDSDAPGALANDTTKFWLWTQWGF